MPSQRRGSSSRAASSASNSVSFDNQPVGPAMASVAAGDAQSAVTELMVQLLSEHRRSEAPARCRRTER